MTPDTMEGRLEEAINAFLQILRSGWQPVGLVLRAGEYPDFSGRYDWVQANWETIVEAAIALSHGSPIALEIYGEGADCNGRSSRVFEPEWQPTHFVSVHPEIGSAAVDALSGESIAFPEGGLALDRFVDATPDGWYEERNPFGHVLVEVNGRAALFELGNVRFSVQSVARPR